MKTAPRIVVMGPAGSGKSVIGAELAQLLGLPFVDADDLHPAQNVAKMAAGTPLDDDDRMPWLDVVAAELRRHADGAVIACSALARRYRDRIRAISPDAWFVELRVDRGELARRMTTREHFMPSSLLDSQLDALEHLGDDEAGAAVVNDAEPAEVVDRIRAALSARQSLR
ncbi:gluconokinase [Microbacterium kyungheense]|uniref:Gluconokinase n=1 Tax=Microbacterium kyungheense TaxID=1263636 RepID=A0A543F1J9_9MICO|nr:gluconokinase [Microbacterium kyungheense]TQM27694.1 gluconate kinase (SKI family) [Microbacterium kyungheense]